MNEEWRPIEGYEGLYEVSSYGRVRGLDRYVKTCYEAYRLYKGKILIPEKTKLGYLLVNLCCNGKVHKKYVHRLVAQTFVPNPENLTEVNHKNEVKSDNCVDNLEWCDRKYNINYGSRLEKSINTKIKNGYVNEENVGLGQEEYMKKYNQDNKDKIKEYKKEYYQKYYQKNKDRISERQKEYYRKKKENIQNNV